MMIDYNMNGVPGNMPQQFNPNEYLRSMGIPQDIVAQGDDAIRKYAEDNGINLVPKGQIPQQKTKEPVPMVEPGKTTAPAPGEITYSKEPIREKTSTFKIQEYHAKRMQEIEADLRQQGLSDKEIKKAMKKAAKDVDAEVKLKFETMSRKDAKAWLEAKKDEIKEQNPNMSKKEIDNKAKTLYQTTFGENPPHGLIHQFFANVFPGINVIMSKIDESKDNNARDNYIRAHLNPQQLQLVGLGIPLQMVVSGNDDEIMKYAQKHNIELPPKA
ncbi:MAG: hypothetical protein NC191_08605 [Muribaculaceae bacterium]|nr:hypothetical protein [Muribaculaceae bacterium]